MEEKNYDFESVYALLVEKFYFLREDYIKAELEDIIDFAEDLEDLEDDDLITIFKNRIFEWMRDGEYEDWVE